MLAASDADGNQARGCTNMFDASIRKVILNLLLEFDESTFSLNVESSRDEGQRGRR